MGVLKFNGTSSELRWTSLASTLSNSITGAWTMAFLVKRRIDTGTWQAAGNMLVSGSAKGGLSLAQTTSALYLDTVGGPGASALTATSAVEQYIIVVGKVAGSSTVRYSRYTKSNNTWAHDNSSGTMANQSAAGAFQLGAWENGDYWDGWIGLGAVWIGNLTDANREALSTNWRTSDWANNAHGAPVFLSELNVAGASVVDAYSNATSLTATATTLDAGETLASWNFDGVGPPPPPPQFARPASDLEAGGWGTAPLFSKVNDSSDATIISGTAV